MPAAFLADKTKDTDMDKISVQEFIERLGNARIETTGFDIYETTSEEIFERISPESDEYEEVELRTVIGWITNEISLDGMKLSYDRWFRYPEFKPSQAELTSEENWSWDYRNFEVFDDDRKLSRGELEDLITEHTDIQSFDLTILGTDTVTELNTDTDMDKITVKNDNAPDIRFTGELMARVKSSPAQAHPSYSNNTGRWTELELYKTQTGKFVCLEIGCTQWQGEHNRYNAKVCDSVEEVTQFFGHGWLAKELYEKANLDTAIDLDAAETLYINTDILGVETYIGTKEEFRKHLADCMKQWHKEAVERGDWDGEADDSLKEYTKECLNDGLQVATPEDLKKYPRLDADGNPPSTYKTASELKASKKSKGQGIN